MTKSFGATWLVRPLAGSVLLFLYLPIVAIVALSFNDSQSVSLPWKGFTLKWYISIFSNAEVMQSLWNSFYVSLGTVLIAVILGVPAAIAMDRYDFPGKAVFRNTVLLPLVLPGIITGISVLGLFLILNIKLSLYTLILALGTSLMCVVVTEVLARLQQIGRSQELAAYDMGAGEAEVFWRITLPNIGSALFGAVLICFSLAMDELAVSYLLIGRENTLPMYVWSALRREVTPEVNAIATITIVFSLVLISVGVMVSNRMRNRDSKE